MYKIKKNKPKKYISTGKIEVTYTPDHLYSIYYKNTEVLRLCNNLHDAKTIGKQICALLNKQKEIKPKV